MFAEAINEHLLDPKTNGLYYLNIELDGTKRTDVTPIIVFPLMFGVADEERPPASSAACPRGILEQAGIKRFRERSELRRDPRLWIARRRMGGRELLVCVRGGAFQPGTDGAFVVRELSALFYRPAA